MPKKFVLKVPNHHIKSCGSPPQLVAERVYTSYFENEHGEQLIFQYDHVAQEGTLWHGDIGWQHPFKVTRSTTLTEVLSTIILDPSEVVWLSACFLATIGSQLH